MSGIYIHIPFCAQRCIYCDFHSGTDMSLQSRYVHALLQELNQRCNEIQDSVQTLYIGGGTPSLLSETLLLKLFEGISAVIDLENLQEITMECNPDDLTEEYLSVLSKFPINRLSMGVQSFNDAELKFLNRRHDVKTAIKAIERCRKYGFKNISIDLMYALPGQSSSLWENSLNQAIALGVEHISAYSLMYEEGTALSSRVRRGAVEPLDDETSVALFDQMIESLDKHGYEQYEISNFAKSGKRSQHNSSYWRGIHYVGLGAGAHSYNGNSRRWNVSHTKNYCEGVEEQKIYWEVEELNPQELFNEMVFTALRTKEGVEMALLEKHFPPQWVEEMLTIADKYLKNGNLEICNGYLSLTRQGIYISDSIMSDLIRV